MTHRHVEVNRDYWNGMAHDWVAMGEQAWAMDAPTWGNWQLPEAELQLLPEDMTGLDAVELGCGTGYVSAWMRRRGARVTGIDVSSGQLATARRLADQHHLDVTFLEGDAEALDFADASMDFAISEYGAAIWCDPDVWLREAWRVLRPGGRLVFLGSHPMTIVATDLLGSPCDWTLHRPYKDMNRIDWTKVEIDPGGIEFNRTIAGWFDLFREIGFVVDRYLELFAPETATEQRFHIPADWAKSYPSEQVWVLSKPA
ncbi:MAG: class I SAM-dependent methyltransferase [Paracoccaceae bacterium]